jgi:hypothetical protein
MEGPWYTLTEIAEKLDIKASELHHLISNKKITPVVYTKPREFLLFIPKDTGWTGFAVCQYRGHLSLHYNHLMSLLDGDPVTIGRGYGSLIEGNGVQYWRSQYPFKKPLPHKPLTEWKEVEQDSISIQRFSATPSPSERVPRNIQIKKGAALIQATIINSQRIKNGEVPHPTPAFDLGGDDDLVLYFEGEPFQPDDLRIAASELERLRPTEDKRLNNYKTEGQRTNLLHELILRIMLNNPEIKARAVWKIMEEDNEMLPPIYDADNIIDSINASELSWRSVYDNVQFLKKTSLSPLISKLKKRI